MDGRVDGVSLGITAHHGVVREDVGQVAFALRDGLHVALPAGFLDAVFHVGLHVRVGTEVLIDKLLGLAAVHAHALGQPEGRYAVDDAEVGRLGLRALGAGHLGDGLLVDFGGRGGVDVVSLAKRLQHVRVLAQVGHDAQLDLRIVGREELTAVVGDERLAYLLAVFVAHGDVLQVRVARTEASRGRHRLVERGVDAPRVRVDQRGQGVDVGAQQLAQAAVVEDFLHDGVFRLQAFEHLLGGDILAFALGLLGFVRHFQLVEEHLAHLLGRGYVEFLARQLVDFLLYLAHAGREVFRRLPQGYGVDAHTVAFHVGQHGHEGHLDFLEQAAGAVLVELFLQDVFQLQGDVGVFAGIAVDVGGREVAHVFLLAPFRADEFFDVDGLVFEVDFRQVVHAVVQFGLEHVVGYHGVEHRSAHFCAVMSEHEDVVFDVLPNLQALFAGQGRLELVYDALCIFASGRDGDVVCLVFPQAEAHAHQLGQHRLGVGRLGVQGKRLGAEQSVCQRFAVGVGLHQVVCAGEVFEP